MEKNPVNFKKKIDFDVAGFKDLLLLLIIKNAYYRRYDNSLLVKVEMGAQSSLEFFNVTEGFLPTHISQMDSFLEVNKNQVLNTGRLLNFHYFVYLFDDISLIPDARDEIRCIYQKSVDSGIICEFIIIDLQGATYETISKKRLVDRKLEKELKFALQTAGASREQFIDLCENTKNAIVNINKELVGKKSTNSINSLNILIFSNIFIFIIGLVLLNRNGVDYFKNYGVQSKPEIMSGEIWRLFTSMFLHASVQHLLGNMLFLYLIGKIILHLYGNKRFITIYLITGLIANIASLLVYTDVNSLGASGAIMGIGGVMFYKLFIDKNKVLRYAGNYVIFVLMILFSILSGFFSNGIDNIAHITGFITGLIAAVLLGTFDRIRNKKVK